MPVGLGKNQRNSIALPAERKDFWEFLISRHPAEEDYAASTKNPYRWRNIPELRLVIVQFVSLNGVGVFVRGERGANSDEVAHRLWPYNATLKKALGVGDFFFAQGEAKYFLHKFKKFRSSGPNNWEKMADWLHKEANAYEHTLRQVLSVAVPSDGSCP